jgi:hypothetical protein
MTSAPGTAVVALRSWTTPLRGSAAGALTLYFESGSDSKQVG